MLFLDQEQASSIVWFRIGLSRRLLCRGLRAMVNQMSSIWVDSGTISSLFKLSPFCINLQVLPFCSPRGHSRTGDDPEVVPVMVRYENDVEGVRPADHITSRLQISSRSGCQVDGDWATGLAHKRSIPHQTYEHYRNHGFGGHGAKTSWAHHPLGLPYTEPQHFGKPSSPAYSIQF